MEILPALIIGALAFALVRSASIRTRNRARLQNRQAIQQSLPAIMPGFTPGSAAPPRCTWYPARDNSPLAAPGQRRTLAADPAVMPLLAALERATAETWNPAPAE